MAQVPPPTYYSKLPGGDEALSDDAESAATADNAAHRLSLGHRHGRWIFPALNTCGIIVMALAFFSLGKYFQPLDEIACLDTTWDDIRKAVRFKTIEFDPFLADEKSPYMGEPTAEIDQRWEKLAAIRAFGVDRATLLKLNRTKAAVQYPQSGTYKAAVEVFHHLHCLNYIRMYTFYDYYSIRNPVMLSETEEERADHKDHCIETLRQATMCRADLNVYTYHWSRQYEQPVGNLFSRHRCIDWNYFTDWVVEHGPKEPKPKKPLGGEMWEDTGF